MQTTMKVIIYLNISTRSAYSEAKVPISLHTKQSHTDTDSTNAYHLWTKMDLFRWLFTPQPRSQHVNCTLFDGTKLSLATLSCSDGVHDITFLTSNVMQKTIEALSLHVGSNLARRFVYCSAHTHQIADCSTFRVSIFRIRLRNMQKRASTLLFLKYIPPYFRVHHRRTSFLPHKLKSLQHMQAKFSTSE